MYNHIENFSEDALLRKPNKNFSDNEWFNAYGVGLYLLSDDSKKSVKAVNFRDKKLKSLLNNQPDVVTLDDVRKIAARTKSVDDLYDVVNRYEAPTANRVSRSVALITVMEQLKQENVPEALNAIANLPVDYKVESTVWGQVITFVVAALSGDYKAAQFEASILISRLQSDNRQAHLACMLPALCVKYLPEAHWPWQFKKTTIEWEGELYHCMPIVIHNKEAEGGNEFMKIPWSERRETTKVYAYDAYGRKGHSMASTTTNAMTATASAVGSLAANVAIQSVAAIARQYSKGRFRAFSLNSYSNTLVLKKDVKVPINSCGYVITKDEAMFDEWAKSDSNVDMKAMDAFLNFADNEAHQPKKSTAIADVKGLIAALQAKMNS